MSFGIKQTFLSHCPCFLFQTGGMQYAGLEAQMAQYNMEAKAFYERYGLE
jgi:hypothetical protein